MTPEERTVLQQVGEVIAQALALSVPTTLLYAICAPIFAWVILFLIGRKSWFKILVIALGLGGSTVDLALMTVVNFLLLNVIASNQSLPLGERAAAYNLQATKLDITNSWISNLVPIMNDCFIVWRAWILFQKTQRRHWILHGLGVLCFISSVTTLVAAGLMSNVGTYNAGNTNGGDAATHLSDVGGVMSFITNSAATAVIGWILWRHYKSLPRNNKSQIRKSFNSVWRVLALLVESGAVYGVLQLINVVIVFGISYDQSSLVLVYDVMAVIFYSISFVYPALTLFLIHGASSLAGPQESIISAVISDDLGSQERPNGDVLA